MKKLMILFGTLLSTFPVLADILETPPVVPRNLHVYDSRGETYVALVAQGCTGAGYYLDPNHPKYDAIFSILLSAQLANKEVVARYDGCRNNDTQGNIIGVYLKSS